MLLANREKSDLASGKKKGYLDEIGYDPEKTRSRSPSGMRKDERGKEGLSEKPGKEKPISLRTIIFVIGLSLIILSTAFAFIAYETQETPKIQDTDEYELFQAVLASEELNYVYGPGANYFHGSKLMAVSSSDIVAEISEDHPGLDDYQFVIEVIDVSDYSSKYTRSIADGSAIQTSPLPSSDSDSDVTTFETAVSIFVFDNEIHSAKFVMHIW